MPKLDRAFNGIEINNTNPRFNCSAFDEYKPQNFIRDIYHFTRPTDTANTNNITANANPTLSYGSEVGIGVGVGIAVITCITTIIYLVKKNYLSKDKPEKSPAGDGSEVSELPQGKHYEKAEVSGERGATLELPLGRHHETGRCLLSMRRENCMENDSGQCTADHTPETCGEN